MYSAAGGLLSTPSDISKFFMELKSPEHISKSYINEMLSQTVALNAYNFWGLGIGIQKGNEEGIIWQSGNNGNKWIALAYASVGDKIGMIVITKDKNGYYINQNIFHKAIGGS